MKTIWQLWFAGIGTATIFFLAMCLALAASVISDVAAWCCVGSMAFVGLMSLALILGGLVRMTR